MKCPTVLLVIIIAAAFSLTAGCIGINTSKSSSVGSCILYNHTFEGESTFLHAHEKITYNVTTDGAPVNVLVLDSKAYEAYRNTTNGNGTHYTALLTRLNVDQINLSYTVPADDVYYVVVDNTGTIPGGVDGNRDILVNTSGSFNWA